MGLDTLAQKFFTASPSIRDALYSEALELVASAGSSAKHYVRVMEKIVNGSVGYIEKETKRYTLPTYHCWSGHLYYLWLPIRLESILSKRNLASSKLDEIKIKVNILKSFVTEKEAPKETISREEAEL